MTTVLVVDDSATIRMTLTMMLNKQGYETATAGDGVEALALLSSGLKPDIIMTDLNMPNMDGIAFIREARKAPGMSATPILMLTTESQQAKRDEAKAVGATGWLVKPVKIEGLVSVLKHVHPDHSDR